MFFIDDILDPHWKVVLRYKPRKRQTCEETDVPFFGAPSCEDGSLQISIVNHGRGLMLPTDVNPDSGVLPKELIIRREIVQCVDANTRIPETNAIYTDIYYEDDINMTYMEV